MTSTIMTRNSTLQVFIKFAIPATIAMLLSGAYQVVDGFFVGQATGDLGLAAIGFAYPIALFITALGAGIGAGGAVIMATHTGNNHIKAAKQAFMASFKLLLLLSALISALGLPSLPLILKALHCPPAIYNEVTSYLKIIIAGAALQILSVGLLPFLRNIGRPKTAMGALAIGLIGNIALDWLFVFELSYGVFGSALATVIAQGFAALFCLYLFLRSEESVKLDKELLRHSLLRCKQRSSILRTSIAPFGLCLTQGLVILFHNERALSIGGELGIAAYSVIDYATVPILLLLSGLGDGLQPLASYYRGANLKQREKAAVRIAVLTAIIVGFTLSIALIVFEPTLIQIFNPSKTVSIQVQRGLYWFALGAPFLGFVKITEAYWYATGRAKAAAVLIYGESLIILPLMLFGLPYFIEPQLDGVWAAAPFAYIVLTVLTSLCLFVKKLFFKSKKLEQNNGKAKAA